MKKYIYKYAYHIICGIFILCLLSVVIFRDNVKSDFGIMFMNYGFWYSFGLLSGFSFAIFIFKRTHN